MKKIGVTYSMKKIPESGSGIVETAESYIELPVSDKNAVRIIENGTSHMLEGTIDRICMLQGYYIEKIRKVEEV